MAKDVLLSKQNLVDKIINEVSKLLDDSVVVTSTCFAKTNVIRDGIILKEKGCNIAPTIYLDQYVSQVNSDESNISEVAAAIVEAYQRNKICDNYDASWFSDYEGQVKNRLRVKLINTAWNQETLKDVPSVPFLDLSIVIFCVVPDFDGIQGSILVNNSHLNLWKQDLDTVFKIALSNTIEQGYEVKSISTVLAEMMGVDELPTESIPEDMLYVLTNKSKHYGSVLFTMETLLAEFVKEQENKREKKIDKVLIIPSSVHETLLICSDDSSEIEHMHITEMIKSINADASIMNAEDVLSDHPYMYLANEHKIICID